MKSGNLLILLFIQIFYKTNFIKKEQLLEIANTCGVPAEIEISIVSALKKIGKENSEAIILFTGSLYFAGEILNLN